MRETGDFPILESCYLERAYLNRYSDGLCAGQQRQDFSFLHCFETGSRTHPASYRVGTRACFPRDKVAGAWSWQFHLCWDQNWWSYTSTLPYVFLAWCLIKHRDNFTFTLLYEFDLGNAGRSCMLRQILRNQLLEREAAHSCTTNLTTYVEGT
jgi:hypothetical protein